MGDYSVVVYKVFEISEKFKTVFGAIFFLQSYNYIILKKSPTIKWFFVHFEHLTCRMKEQINLKPFNFKVKM